jgi:hypothetical protein
VTLETTLLQSFAVLCKLHLEDTYIHGHRTVRQSPGHKWAHSGVVWQSVPGGPEWFCGDPAFVNHELYLEEPSVRSIR